MKKFKVMLSVFMVILIIIVSVMPAFAKTLGTTHQVVISEDLTYVMKNSKPDEKIKVYIWYKDIDQDEVDALTTKATGLTPEKCAVIEEFPSTELLYSLRDGEQNAKKQMDEYMKRTESVRNLERERTDTYSRKHMEIANEKYIQKSKNVLDAISVSSNDVEFSSQLAPMIIAEMTKSEIENAAKNPNVDDIFLFYDYDETVPVNCSVEYPTYKNQGTYAKESLNLNSDFYSVYGLTGAGVNVGLLETHLPGPFEASGADLGFDFSDITVVQDNYAPIYPSMEEDSNKHGHANNTIRVMKHEKYGIAKDIKVYASDYKLRNIEALLKSNERLIDVLEVNYAYLVKDREYQNECDRNSTSVPNSTFAYQSLEKYYDHIISKHNIITVIAGGNWGDKKDDYYFEDTYLSDGDDSCWTAGARVSSPGLAYNAITVGGYYTNETKEKYDDILCNYSWKNSYISEEENVAYFGCEKPDVVMPIDFYYGGTSESSPALTAQIALMLELKPSLSLHPEAVKAIVLASCHRKVNQTSNQGEQETMTQGLTERQGAGVPDAWTMASIVCQGTYGFGLLNGSGTTINFEQPSYGASNMNISVTWLRENTDTNPLGIYNDASDIEEGQASNLDLSIYRNDMIINSSLLEHSSTEMCYIPLSESDCKYQLRLTQKSTSTSVRYAYAWSTDNMYAPISISQDAIYYIKNKASSRYITYDTVPMTPQAIQKAVNTQSGLSDVNRWILEQNNGLYSIMTGYGNTKLYLGQGSTVSDNSYVSQLSSTRQDINLLYNNDGTVSFLNDSGVRVLTYSGSILVWNVYSGDPNSLLSKQKWYLEKANYLCGDANMDGDLEVGGYSENEVNEQGKPIALPGLDQTFVQEYLAGIVNMNNLQMFLADINKDDKINIFDATFINQFAEQKFY